MNLGEHIKSIHVAHPDEELHEELSMEDAEKQVEQVAASEPEFVRPNFLTGYIG